MNKTLTINIAGLSFHIDEDAYQRLNDYLESVRNSLNDEGREEIMADIEARIAEIFAGNVNNQKEVIGMKDVNQVIDLLGQPEDYMLGEEEDNNHKEIYYSGENYSRRNKKLYRDGERRLLGGVLSGLGRYLNIDVVWLRLLFILLLFAYGASAIVYIVLWIIVPKARTTSEILEMYGEPVTIDSIEKRNLKYAQNKKEYYDRVDNNSKRLVNAIQKTFGIFLLVLGILGMIGAVIATFAISMGSSSNIFGENIIDFVSLGYPKWAVLSAFFGLIFLPCIAILLFGLSLLYSNIRYLGLSLIGIGILWGISLVYFSIVGIDLGMQKKKFFQDHFNSYKTEISKEIIQTEKDTLLIDFVRDSRMYSVNDSITNGNFYKEYRRVNLEILSTPFDTTYMEVKSKTFYDKKTRVSISKNNSYVETIHTPKVLPYQYNTEDNRILLSDALLATDSSWRVDNQVTVYLYLPKGKTIRLNEKYENYINNDDIEDGIQYYQFENGILKCVSCPPEHDDNL